MAGKFKILCKIESKGIEIEAFYKKSEKFNVSLNYNYTDTMMELIVMIQMLEAQVV